MNHKDTFEFKPTGFKQVLRVTQNIVSYVVVCENEEHAMELYDVWSDQTNQFKKKVHADLTLEGKTVVYVIDMVKHNKALELYRKFKPMWYGIVNDYKANREYTEENVVFERIKE